MDILLPLRDSRCVQSLHHRLDGCHARKCRPGEPTHPGQLHQTMHPPRSAHSACRSPHLDELQAGCFPSGRLGSDQDHSRPHVSDDSPYSETKEVASNQNSVTLSGLLNVLDGFAAPTGVLFAMTTNHVEKLDPALLRPGRIDYKLYLGKASDRQKVELYRRFFPESSEAAAFEFVEAAGSGE